MPRGYCERLIKGERLAVEVETRRGDRGWPTLRSGLAAGVAAACGCGAGHRPVRADQSYHRRWLRASDSRREGEVEALGEADPLLLQRHQSTDHGVGARVRTVWQRSARVAGQVQGMGLSRDSLRVDGPSSGHKEGPPLL